jgi:hypothetical protein
MTMLSRPGDGADRWHAVAMGRWVDAVEDGTEWGYPLLRSNDYEYDEVDGAGGQGELVAPDGTTHAFDYFAGAVLKIELTDEALGSLGRLPAYFRSLGLGRLRRDHSLPLLPPADRIWIQSTQDEAVLVTSTDRGGTAFFRLGELHDSTRRMALTGMVPVLFLVGVGVLPDPTMRQEARAAAAGRAWGGLVAATAEAGG